MYNTSEILWIHFSPMQLILFCTRFYMNTANKVVSCCLIKPPEWVFSHHIHPTGWSFKAALVKVFKIKLTRLICRCHSPNSALSFGLLFVCFWCNLAHGLVFLPGTFMYKFTALISITYDCSFKRQNERKGYRASWWRSKKKPNVSLRSGWRPNKELKGEWILDFHPVVVS